ncbi:sensor histidine kinase [Nocardioides sp. HDW12B]|uniref:sensor histidine kinase n=1 Tax=Nocardioides sp. HDW12B TaxID=2714939 RepID=UPI00140DBE36|nr:sensor histidine kinase [Nocardioides sp. HDW12B]QIK67276.1 sensor histidine kinase [Nocardioides sp. HDW12B]
MSNRLRPFLVDVGIAVVLATAMLRELALDTDSDADTTPAAVAVIVLAVLPVALLRSRRPGWALALSMLALVPLQMVIPIHQTIPIPSMVAGYSYAVVADRRRAVLAASLVAPAVLANLAVASDHGLLSFETFKNLAFVFLPLALGAAAHDRRAYQEALVDRAETAERTREEEAKRRVDEERLRIARDLHDMVAHSLVAINVQAGVAAHVQDPDPETNRQTFRHIKQVSGEALADLRTTLGVLRAGDAEAPVAPTPGLDQLPDLVAVLATSGVTVDLDVDPALTAGSRAGASTVGAATYRIVQEALTNVMRHAGSVGARVTVRRDGARLRVEVENDAPAPGRQPTPGSGHGVQGMRERAAAAGGTLDAGPTPEGGWRVRASLPLTADAAGETDRPVEPLDDVRAPDPSAQGSAVR